MADEEPARAARRGRRARSSSCAMRRSGRTSIPACRRSTRTGATSSRHGSRRACSFNQTYHMAELMVEGPDALALLTQPRGQQLRDLRAGQGQAVRPLHARRLRDRRRHPLRPRRGPLQPRRPRAGAQLGHLPRRDRRTRRRGPVRPAHRAAQRRAPAPLPLPGPGAQRDGGHREGPRPCARGPQVLQHARRADRRRRGHARCATAWPASRAGSSSGRWRTARRCTRRS